MARQHRVIARNQDGIEGRVYISGKMTGLDRVEWRRHFSKAEVQLIKYGYHPYNILNPSRLVDLFPALDYEEYMRLDVVMLTLCDTIYMLTDYENSRGAQRELEYAKQLGMNVMYQSDIQKDN